MITIDDDVDALCLKSEKEKVGLPDMFSRCPLYLYHGPAAEI
jgi:hypothetical protein